MIFQTVNKSCVMAILAVGTLILPTFANAELSTNSAIASQTNRQMPSDESIDKLVAVRQLKKSLSTLSKSNQPALLEIAKTTAMEIGQNEHLTDNQIQQVQIAYTKYLQEMVQGNYFKDLQTNYIDNYKATAKAVYTQQEIDAMIAFYSSPMGQKIQDKQPQFDTMYAQKLVLNLHKF